MYVNNNEVVVNEYNNQVNFKKFILWSWITCCALYCQMAIIYLVNVTECKIKCRKFTFI